MRRNSFIMRSKRYNILNSTTYTITTDRQPYKTGLNAVDTRERERERKGGGKVKQKKKRSESAAEKKASIIK